MAGPTREFWDLRFESGATPCDRGEVNPQLYTWLDAGALRPCRILVPGCGSGYEVAELAARGFATTGLDYSPQAMDRARKLIDSANLRAELVRADVLDWSPERPYDAVYEQ